MFPASRGLQSRLALLALLAVSSGCGSSGSGVALSNVPRNLGYPGSPLVFALGVPGTPASPQLTGVATEWRVSPALPSGLSIDPTNGTIRGTPKQISDRASYKVTALGNYGSTTAQVELAITLPAQDGVFSAATSGRCAVSAPGANVGAWLPAIGGLLGAFPRMAVNAPSAGALLVLVAGGEVRALRIDGATFLPSLVGTSPVLADASAIAVQDDVALVLSASQQKVAAYRIEPVTAALSLLATADTELDPTALATVRDGADLLVVCRGSSLLMRFRLDRVAGTLIPIESVPLGRGASDLAAQDGAAIGAESGLALVANRDAGQIDAFAIDRANGDLRFVQRLFVGGKPTRIALDPTLRRAVVLGAEPSELVVLGISSQRELSIAGRADLTGASDTLSLAVDAREVLALDSGTGIVRSFAFDSSGAPIAGRMSAFAPGTNVLVSLPTAAAAKLVTRGMLAIDRDAGTLVEVPATGQGRVFRLGSGPNALALDRASTFALLGCRGDGTLWRIRLDPVSARVKTIEGPVAVPGGIAGLAIDPAGRFAYVSCDTSNEILTFALDGALPRLVRRSAAGIAPRALAVDPQGRFLAAAITGWNQLDLFYIDQDSGIPFGISYANAGGDPREVTFDLAGRRVYVATGTSGTVLGYAIDDASGALTKIADRVLGAAPTTVVATEEGLVAAENGAALAQALPADPGTGALLALESVALDAGTTRLVPDATRSGFWAVSTTARTLQRVARDPATGKLGVVERIPLGFAPLELVVLATR